MKYFIDTEFIERFHKPWMGKPRHVIDLISIGLVSEDGREYSAISSEYRYEDASDWVKENVIRPLYVATVHGDMRNHCSANNFHKLYGKPNERIAYEIFEFINPAPPEIREGDYTFFDWSFGLAFEGLSHEFRLVKDFADQKPPYMGHMAAEGWLHAHPTFYGYYCDYDWVLFCSLYGTMMDLPPGYPKYCRDLKQMLDESVQKSADMNPEETFDAALSRWKSKAGFPGPDVEHDALADARWNKRLHQFLIEKGI